MINNRVYTVNPETVKFDEKIVKFNPPKSKEEMDSLRYQIESNGQLDPILMRNGLCGDGFHRCEICRKLGITVKCIDVDPDMSDADFIVMCNKNTFGARNDSVSQKAIKAFKLTREYGRDFSDIKASKIVGLKDKRTIGYVRYISDTKYEKDNDVLSKLLRGESVILPDGSRSKSIEVVKRKIKIMEEIELKKKADKEIDNKDIDFSSMCNTAIAEDEFWKMEPTMTTIDTKIRVIELLNHLYREDKGENNE